MLNPAHAARWDQSRAEAADLLRNCEGFVVVALTPQGEQNRFTNRIHTGHVTQAEIAEMLEFAATSIMGAIERFGEENGIEIDDGS
jgi:hypothetical protein